MRLLVVRHGESLANIQKDLGARPGYETMPDAEVPLTRWGREQAFETGRKLAIEYRDNPEYAGRTLRIIHSPFLRTRQTMDALLEGLGDAVKVESITCDERMREQDFGLFNCVTDPAVAMNRWPKEYMDFRAARRIDKHHAKAPGGESRADVVERIAPFVQDVLGSAQDNVDTLIVGHGMVNRGIEMHCLNEDSEWLRKSLNPKNCTVRVIEGGREQGLTAHTLTEGKQRPSHLPAEYKTEPLTPIRVTLAKGGRVASGQGR